MTDNVLGFDSAKSLKRRFRMADHAPAPVPEQEAVAEPSAPATIGEAVYRVYRFERTQQSFEEWKWESLDLAQRLVWERLGTRLGLALNK